MSDVTHYTAAETKRIEFLRKLNILDTENEEIFDNLTALVASLLNVPIVMISLVDENRQWFKSVVGLNICETTREVSFCQHVVNDGRILMIEDTKSDPRFRDNPLVTGEPFIRSYMGIPVRPDGHFVVGTLCVVDTMPREFSGDELSLLASFVLQVEGLLRSHQRRMALQFRYKRLETDKQHVEEIAEAYRLVALALAEGHIQLDTDGVIQTVSAEVAARLPSAIKGFSLAQALDRFKE
ncbi:MAG TPA: GAF domain-containing protein [Pseudomonadales bacterium]|nr:GAF domain-containing protein [Pseudomonadales bacterium]